MRWANTVGGSRRKEIILRYLTHSRTRGLCIAVITAAFLATAVRPHAQQSVTDLGDEEPRENYYKIGNAVEISSPVLGDAVVAGRYVRIAGPVAGDILAAGWTVTVAGEASDDVRIAGGDVNVDVPIDGDLTVAGGDIKLGSKTHVTGRTWLTGGTVRVEGQLDRELQIAGGTVLIDGEIRQPVRIIADQIEILPHARILAGVDYRSPQPAHISDGANVIGPVTFTEIPKSEVESARRASGVSSLLFIVQVSFAGV